MADLGSLPGGLGGARFAKAVVSLELDTAKHQTELKGEQVQTVASAKSMSLGLSKVSGIAKAGLTAAALGVDKELRRNVRRGSIRTCRYSSTVIVIARPQVLSAHSHAI
jgi:hypothetical protein